MGMYQKLASVEVFRFIFDHCSLFIDLLSGTYNLTKLLAGFSCWITRRFLEERTSRTPLERIAEPEEVSSLVAFLRLPAGQIISVDGGMTISSFNPTSRPF